MYNILGVKPDQFVRNEYTTNRGWWERYL